MSEFAMRDFQGQWVPSDDPNDGMHAMFYVDTVEDVEGTRLAREADPTALLVWKEVAKVRKRSANDGKTEWDTQVKDADKQQFGKAWAAFEKGAIGEIVGTPLHEWAAIPRSVVRGLYQQGVMSVEDVAAMVDADLPVLGKGGYALRAQARVFLKPKDKAVAELERDNVNLHQKIKELEARLEQAVNMPRVEPEDAAPKRRGRPPINKELAS